MTSRGCKAFSILINFLILRSINMGVDMPLNKEKKNDLTEFFSFSFKEWSWISYKGGCPGVYPFDEISAIKLSFEKFSDSYNLSFISTCLMLFGSNIINYLKFYFPLSVLILSWIGSSISSTELVVPFHLLFLFSRFLLSVWCLFQCKIPFLYPDSILLLMISASPVFKNILQIILYHQCI